MDNVSLSAVLYLTAANKILLQSSRFLKLDAKGYHLFHCSSPPTKVEEICCFSVWACPIRDIKIIIKNEKEQALLRLALFNTNGLEIKQVDCSYADLKSPEFLIAQVGFTAGLMSSQKHSIWFDTLSKLIDGELAQPQLKYVSYGWQKELTAFAIGNQLIARESPPNSIADTGVTVKEMGIVIDRKPTETASMLFDSVLNVLHSPKSVLFLSVGVMGILYSLLERLDDAQHLLRPRMVLMVYGSSNTGKSTITRFFFCPFMSSDNFVSLRSTPAAIEAAMKTFNDCVVVFDDFSPSGLKGDFEQKLESILRTSGDVGGERQTKNDVISAKAVRASALASVTSEFLTYSSSSSMTRLLPIRIEFNEVDFKALNQAIEDSVIGTFYYQMIQYVVECKAEKIYQTKFYEWREQLREELETGYFPRLIDNFATVMAVFEIIESWFEKYSPVHMQELKLQKSALKDYLLETAEFQQIEIFKKSPITGFLLTLLKNIKSGNLRTEKISPNIGSRWSFKGNFDELPGGFICGNTLYLTVDSESNVSAKIPGGCCYGRTEMRRELLSNGILQQEGKHLSRTIKVSGKDFSVLVLDWDKIQIYCKNMEE